ncbi:hypothetical protein BH11PLA1_BH11PLA1_00560 [soil metagenome]
MVRINETGDAVFRIFLPDANRVELIGDFTDWTRERIVLNRENPGWWEAGLHLDAGDHQFCYLIDGSLRLADYAAHGVKLDRHGQWLSELRVSAVKLAVV